MQIDIANHIEKLLFEHDTVIIPGFGGFTATKSPSSVDTAAGSVLPPAKLLVFNENLKIDDGILVYDIARTHGLENTTAQMLIQEFVEKTTAQLNARDIVTLPGVGRLYKNYEQKVQFLPDTTNFNPDAFGLPPLQFSPLARSREVADIPAAPTPPPFITTPPPVVTEPMQAPTIAEKLAAAAVAPPPAFTPPPVVTAPPPPPTFTPPPAAPTPVPDPSTSYSGLWIGLVAAALLLGAAGLGYQYWQKTKAERAALAAETEELTSGIDTAGAAAETEVEYIPPADDQAPRPITSTPAPAKPAADSKKPAPAPAAKPAPARPSSGGKSCLLIIGTFSNASNAGKLVRKLESNNLSVYRRSTSIGEQIGIEFNYADQGEIEDKIALLQRLTGERNIVVKKR